VVPMPVLYDSYAGPLWFPCILYGSYSCPFGFMLLCLSYLVPVAVLGVAVSILFSSFICLPGFLCLFYLVPGREPLGRRRCARSPRLSCAPRLHDSCTNSALLVSAPCSPRGWRRGLQRPGSRAMGRPVPTITFFSGNRPGCTIFYVPCMTSCLVQ
jgi:hypothetical protein